MNNNRNNNRRRGRGNRQQQGGGNQNRIDSRARGNAPQMFDKYKKLAQDAAHNGDRVQAEYFLQFADHYFRVIADNKARMDEQRGGRGRDERDYAAEEESEEDDFDGLRQPHSPRFNDRQAERGERSSERQRPRRDEPRRDDEPRGRGEGDPGYEGEEASDFDAGENPFVRGSRERGRNREFGSEREGTRDNGRQDSREGESRRGRARRNAHQNSSEPSLADDAGEIDAAALPPAFARAAESDPADDAPSQDASAQDAPTKRKLPPRRRRPAPGDAGEAGEGGESLKAVG